jgi:membrane protein YqaA with SNARE-associated domain
MAAIRTKKRRGVTDYHKIYKRTGLYKFLCKNCIYLILTILFFVGIIILFQQLIGDFDTFFKSIIKGLDLVYVYLLFFASESILGLIPPDIFIIWSKTLPMPYASIALLSILSYLGGINSYFIGKLLKKIPSIKRFVLKQQEKYYKQIKKWGGILIVVAALFPLPFAMICIIAGIINYPFKRFLLITLTRIVRFFAYAWIFFNFIH